MFQFAGSTAHAGCKGRLDLAQEEVQLCHRYCNWATQKYPTVVLTITTKVPYEP